MDIRVGNGYDVHALGQGLRLVLAGVEIPHTHGCIAHSDGDVAIHSLCDAMLGALALGDFPDNNDEFKGIDSTILLERVCRLVNQRGYHLINADITIAMQSPKLAGYIPAMRERIAQVCGVESDRISVKATTTEKLGFVGRREGVEVYSVVLIGRD